MLSATVAGRMRAPAAPDVLLIVVDTLRADHLGCYGYPRPTSPRLDALAAAGVRFANARAPSSWTGASVASIMTGLYPAVHGLEQSESALADERPTIAEAFRDAGYDTIAFSANPAYVTPVSGLGQGFARFDVLHGKRMPRNARGNVAAGDPRLLTRFEQATAKDVTDAVLRWLDGRASALPFFAYVHYFDPHAGYFPPPEYARRFGVAPDAPLATKDQQHMLVRPGLPSADEFATLIGLYDGEIAFTDAEIARLLAALPRARPTLIVVTSDHGEEFGEHGGLQHGRTLFDEQLKIPLIMAGAGLPAGTVVDEPASLVDLWPTIAALVGRKDASAPEGIAGRDLLTAARTRTAPEFADLATAGGIHRRAVILGDWKLVVAIDDKVSLYDLAADAGERRDLATPAEQARVASLQRALAVRDGEALTARAAAPPVTIDLTPGRRERLKALGYLR
jgi:arylsulfatase A-like enzyme